MGRIYERNNNLFQDFLFISMMYGTDLADKDFEADIYVGFSTILEYYLNNNDDIRLLDFEIRGNDGYYKVVAKNAISALWLSGIFPRNPKQVLNSNEYVIENMKYKFNTKTMKLTHQFIKK